MLNKIIIFDFFSSHFSRTSNDHAYLQIFKLIQVLITLSSYTRHLSHSYTAFVCTFNTCDIAQPSIFTEWTCIEIERALLKSATFQPGISDYISGISFRTYRPIYKRRLRSCAFGFATRNRVCLARGDLPVATLKTPFTMAWVTLVC